MAFARAATLGALALPFTIGFGGVVVPNDHATAITLAQGSVPIYFPA